MSIILYIGCMFSGKTSELISEYTRWKNIGKKVVLINYTDDNRYGEDNFVYSHDKHTVPCIKTKCLNEIDISLLRDNDVILINEGQFFPDLLIFCKYWCETKNKHIVVCGLDGTFKRTPFGQINILMSIADDVIKKKALCVKCADGTPAIFTKRISDETEEIIISNNYIPVCRKHHLE